jgi:hypothetical protein
MNLFDQIEYYNLEWIYIVLGMASLILIAFLTQGKEEPVYQEQDEEEEEPEQEEMHEEQEDAGLEEELVPQEATSHFEEDFASPQGPEFALHETSAEQPLRESALTLETDESPELVELGASRLPSSANPWDFSVASPAAVHGNPGENWIYPAYR